MATDLNEKAVTTRALAPAVFRGDIQGLRAIAVLVVILDHLLGWPAGGFIGVDVFFVISGFLITSLMLREQRATGRISWIGFYRRRVKRIIPAATVVLVVTVAASYLVYRAARFQSVLGDAVWSFFFASNWHYAAAGSDYLNGDGPVSPLQHFWSLSLEEQFYIVWPLLIIGVLGVAASRTWARGIPARKVLFVLTVTVGVTSFVWAMVETATSPNWAYYSTFARAWELAVGAGLAVAAGFVSRLPAKGRSVMTYAGLAAIVASLFLINTYSRFPGPWAALPTIGAALVIAAGIGGSPRLIWPLTNPASVYVGKVSYSLYLWHFPVIILLASVIPGGSLTYYLAAVIAMFVLAVASFHLVEDPVRRSGWLEPKRWRRHTKSNPAEPARAWRVTNPAKPAKAWRVTRVALLGGWAAITLVIVAIALQVPTVDVSAVSSASDAAPPQLSAAGDAGPQGSLTAEITAALVAQEWPDLTPSLDSLGRDAMAPEWMTDGCLGGEQRSLADPRENVDHCVYGDPAASRTAVLLGDSVAISYLPGIRAALEPAGWRIDVMTLVQCPVADVPLTKIDGSAYTECNDFRHWTLDRVAALHPDLVVTSESPNTLKRLVGEPSDGEALATWVAGMSSSLARLTESADRVVVLAAPPGTGTRDVERCTNSLATPEDCVYVPGGDYHRLVQAEFDLVAAQGLTYVPTEPWFCSSLRCPDFVATTTVFADAGHITSAYSQRLAPVLAEVLG